MTGFLTAGEDAGVDAEAGAGVFFTMGFDVFGAAAGVLAGVVVGFLRGVEEAAVLIGVADGVLLTGKAFLVPIGVRGGFATGVDVEILGAAGVVFLTAGLPDGLDSGCGTVFFVPIGVRGFAAGDAVFLIFATPARHWC
jgi:hypothetical protein